MSSACGGKASLGQCTNQGIFTVPKKFELRWKTHKGGGIQPGIVVEDRLILFDLMRAVVDRGRHQYSVYAARPEPFFHRAAVKLLPAWLSNPFHGQSRGLALTNFCADDSDDAI